MNLSSLLRKKLKDDDILEILEFFEIEVVYDFDRLHENLEDKYWAPAKSVGFQLCFNEGQVLKNIFCYIVANEGFSPISNDMIGVPVYKTYEAAEQACKTAGVKYSASPRVGWWIRIEAANLWSHYQFKDGALVLLTLSVPKP